MDDGWHHLAVVLDDGASDGSEARSDVYIDGELRRAIPGERKPSLFVCLCGIRLRLERQQRSLADPHPANTAFRFPAGAPLGRPVYQIGNVILATGGGCQPFGPMDDFRLFPRRLADHEIQGRSTPCRLSLSFGICSRLSSFPHRCVCTGAAANVVLIRGSAFPPHPHLAG